jgi:hypothetical protein
MRGCGLIKRKSSHRDRILSYHRVRSHLSEFPTMIQNIPHQTKCILKIALIGENLRLMLEHLELNQAQPEAACWLEDLVEQSDSIRDWQR